MCRQLELAVFATMPHGGRVEHLTHGQPVYHSVLGRGVVRSTKPDGVLVDFERGGRRLITRDRLTPEPAARTSASRIFPDPKSLDHPESFIPALTRFEGQLVSILDRELSDEWHIYVRPHLDGDLPSAATLSRQHGVVIWDVDEGAELAESSLRRIGTKNGGRLRRLERIRKRIYGEYLSGLGERVSGFSGGFGTIRVGVFAPNLRHIDLVDEVPRWLFLICSDDLAGEPAVRVAPSVTGDERLTEAEWLELHALLANYYRRPEALQSVRLTPQQERLAQPEPGFHRIDGVAGSGKSQVLAMRAKRVADAGGRALIVTFNRTLVNYVRGILRSLPDGYDPKSIWVRHFHDVCWMVLDDGGRQAVASRAEAWQGQDGLETEGRVPMPDGWYTDDWPRITLAALARRHRPEHLFDAILIDEAQDLTASYFAVLERLLKPGGEMVAVTDEAQRVYRRQLAFAERGVAAKFGRPRQLNTGHRLPPRVAEFANGFASKWGLRTDRIQREETGFDLDAGRAVWIGCGNEYEAAVAAVTTVGELFADGGRPDQVALLVPSKAFGAAMVCLLADDGHGANHIFLVPRTGAPLQSADEAFGDILGRPLGEIIEFEQSLKTAFAYGDQRMKVCTIHSFKGWEADHVIVVCPPSSSQPSSEDLAAAYVAFTRPRSALYVIGVEDTLGIEELMPELLQPPKQDLDAERRFERYLDAALDRPTFRPSPRTSLPASSTNDNADPEPVWEGMDKLVLAISE